MNLKQFLEPYSTILIPRIQRDYAQGRQDNRTKEIRETLLEDVFSGKDVSFNMIFGEGNDDNEFIPIDGQQRLTFLFLLGLYGFKMKKCEDIGVSKLCYATRESASEFWDFITKISWATLPADGKISSWCRDQSGYQWYWNQDPTVESMLTVLDDIHRFAKKRNSIFPNFEKIEFQCHDMRSSGLNETLYLKMNSRGKHLNAFERIKSALDCIVSELSASFDDQSFKDYKWNKETEEGLKSFSEKWSYCMDRQWSNWFWDEQTASLDGTLLKLILAYTYVFISSRENVSYLKNIRSEISGLIGLTSAEILSDSLTVTPQMSHIKAAYLSKDAETGELKENFDLKKAFFEGLATLLSRLTSSDCSFAPSWDSTAIDFRNPALKYENKTLGVLASLMSFRGGKFIGKDFGLWMRFCWNMVQNTVEDDDTLKRFSRNVRKYYSNGSTHILIWLTSDYADKGAMNEQGTNEQLKEEILKASVLQPLCHFYQTDLTESILAAESHTLLRGRLKPLLLNKEEGLSFNGFLRKWANYQTLFTKVGDVIDKVKFIEAYIKSAETQNSMSYRYDSEWSIFRTSPAAIRDKFNDKVYNVVWPNLFSYPLGDHPFMDEHPELSAEINIRKQLLTPEFIEHVLEHWSKEKDTPRIRWYYDTYYLYPSGAKNDDKYLLMDWYGSECNEWDRRCVLLLNELERSGKIKVENEALFNNHTSQPYHAFWLGKDIKFVYEGVRFILPKNYRLYIASDDSETTKESVRGIHEADQLTVLLDKLIAEKKEKEEPTSE